MATNKTVLTTAANLQIFPDYNDGGDAGVECGEYDLEYGGYFPRGADLLARRRASPYKIVLQNECPADAVLELEFRSSMTNLVLAAGAGRMSAGAAAVRDAPFCVKNGAAAVLLHTSSAPGYAALHYRIRRRTGGEVFVESVLGISAADADMEEMWIPPGAPAWQFGALARWSISAEGAGAAADPIIHDETASVDASALPCGGYNATAQFFQIYENGALFTQNAKLHISEIIIEKDAYGARAGPAGAARVSAKASRAAMAAQYLKWEIAPQLPNGARLHSSQGGGGGGAFTLEARDEAWISGGSIPGQNYTLRAYCTQNSNICGSAQVQALDFVFARDRRLLELDNPARYALTLDRTKYTGSADWTLEPSEMSGALLHASPGGATAGGDSLDDANTAWIERGDFTRQYTITATHPVYSNITAQTTIDFAIIELEPVNDETDAGGHVINPSGVPLDANGYRKFKIKIIPESKAADADIQWISPGAEFRNGVSTGREVWVRASAPGEQTLTVSIKDLVDPAPQITFAGNPPKRFVPVRFMIVRDRFGAAATTAANCTAMINDVNKIFDQVAIEFYTESISYTNRQDWWKLDYFNDPRIISLCSSLPKGDGFEVYFVNSIVASNTAGSQAGSVGGFNCEYGMVLTPGLSARNIAHEFGHQCGWPDIYPDDFITQGQASLSISGAVRKEWAPNDWTGDGDYYPGDLTQEDLAWRLLMGGYGDLGDETANEAADIPSGDIYGIGVERSATDGIPWRKKMLPVGRNKINIQSHL